MAVMGEIKRLPAHRAHAQQHTGTHGTRARCTFPPVLEADRRYGAYRPQYRGRPPLREGMEIGPPSSHEIPSHPCFPMPGERYVHQFGSVSYLPVSPAEYPWHPKPPQKWITHRGEPARCQSLLALRPWRGPAALRCSGSSSYSLTAKPAQSLPDPRTP